MAILWSGSSMLRRGTESLSDAVIKSFNGYECRIPVIPFKVGAALVRERVKHCRENTDPPSTPVQM